MNITREQLEAKGLIGKKPAKAKRKPSAKTLARNAAWEASMLRMRSRSDVFFPVYVPSAANLREHWKARHRRIKRQRIDGFNIGLVHLIKDLPCAVTFTRYGPHPLDDDGLPYAFKGYRDGIAKAWGVDDNPAAPVTWKYQQVKTFPGCNGFRVEMTKQP